MRIGDIVRLYSFDYMRITKKTAERCYILGYSFEIIPHGKSTLDYENTITINKKECFGDTFDHVIDSYKSMLAALQEMKKSDYFEYYIPVKAIDNFTGEIIEIKFNTPPESYSFVYNSSAYQKLTV